MDRQKVVNKSLRAGVFVLVSVMVQYIIGFGTQISVARILAPEHFGKLAFASMIAMFFNRFTNTLGDKF